MKIKPHVCLHDTIDYYWVDKGKAGTYRVLPNGAAMLLVNLGTPVRLKGNMDVQLNTSDFMFVGLQDRYFDMIKQDGNHLVGVMFTQAGGYHLIHEQMHFYRNKFSNLINIAEIIKKGLINKLPHANGSYDEVEKLLNHFMILHINSAGRHLATIRYALTKLDAVNTAPSIHEICKEVSLSNKYLIELFKNLVGMPPKTLQRINKFNKVLSLVVDNPDISWADIAGQSRFYDQSHLIKEFKSISGDTPKNFLKKDARRRYYLIGQPFLHSLAYTSKNLNGNAFNGN